MLTKKDFNAITQCLLETRPDRPLGKTSPLFHQWRRDCFALAKGLSQTNPQFDPNRFTEALGITTEL